jgi:hypothetical protein
MKKSLVYVGLDVHKAAGSGVVTDYGDCGFLRLAGGLTRHVDQHPHTAGKPVG